MFTRQNAEEPHKSPDRLNACKHDNLMQRMRLELCLCFFKYKKDMM